MEWWLNNFVKFLFFSEYYKPDGGPAAPLFGMLAEELVNRGHEVRVISTVPHYPSGVVPSNYRGWAIRRNNENGVQIVRIPLPSKNRKILFNRFVQILVYQIGSTIEGFRVNPEVVITHTPAFEVWLPFLIHGLAKKRKTIYSIHDVYPDVGIRMEIFKSKAVINLVTALEKCFIKGADKIRVISKSFKQRVHELGANEEDIILIYDWVDIENIRPMQKDNAFSKEFGMIKSINVMYTGNIGSVQGLETVIQTAKLLEDNSNIQFVFVGEGNAKQDLERQVSEAKLNNVLFIPYQPRERMSEVLASADIGLVCLKKGTGFGALPSKTYSIMASGKPIIASVDIGSDTWDLINRARAGITVQPESPSDLVRAILELVSSSERQQLMGMQGRRYVIENHSPEHAAAIFEKICIEISK